MKDEIVREGRLVTVLREGGHIRITRSFPDETSAMAMVARLKRSRTARDRFLGKGR